MRVLRAAGFTLIMFVVYVVADFIIQVAYRYTPVDDRFISGTFTLGRYTFDTGLFIGLVLFTILFLVWFFMGLYHILVRGSTLKDALPY